MKRIFGLLGLLLLAKAAMAGELKKQQDAVWVHYKTPTAVVTSTAVVLVDISNTATYPHKSAGSARIVGWDIEIDKVAAGTTTVKMGVVTSVNASSGTVSWFYTKTLEKNVSNSTNFDDFKLDPSEINTYVSSSGATPFLLTNEKVTLSDAEALEYQNDVAIPSTSGTDTIPAVGDILLRVIGGGSNTTVVSANVLYYTAP